METNGVQIRWDEGRTEFIAILSVNNIGDFEGSGPELSDAFVSLAEQLAEAGL